MSDRIVLTLRSRPSGAFDASALALHDWSERSDSAIERLHSREVKSLYEESPSGMVFAGGAG